MFNLGERVKHIETGSIGIVIGSGKRIVNNQCLPMVKVKIVSPESQQKITVKELNSKWFPCAQDYRVIYPNPLAQSLILKPVKRYDCAKTA